jgi:diguanylate cyclase (GGDEF)-like protein/PAS domain S-box-containing protein
MTWAANCPAGVRCSSRKARYVDFNLSDAALLAAVLRHPRRGVVVGRAIYDRAGVLTDFVVHRSNGAAEALLEAHLGPGARLSALGDWVVPQVAELVADGGYGQIDQPSFAPRAAHGRVLPRMEACAVGDRVVLVIEDAASEESGPDRWFRGLVESTADVIHVMDRAGVTRYITPGASEVLGYPPEEIVGRYFGDLVHPRDLGRIQEELAEMMEAPPGTVVEGEFRVRHGTGDVRWIHGRAANHLHTPGVEGIVATWRDVTVPRELHSKLEYAATHDALTALPNRAMFTDHLELALAAAERHPDARIAVMFLDLDQFKGVNDSLGHAAGDDLLRQVALRLREIIRPADTVARLGGDEFAILCADLPDEVEAVYLARRVLTSVSGSYRLPGASRDVFVSTSIGVAVSTEHTMAAEDEETMLRDADTALYEAKRRGRGRYELFSDPLRERVTDRLQMETQLRQGIDDGEFVLHYQPKIDLGSDRLVDVEALLRWQHPKRGLLRPSQFLDLAEDTGLIIPIGAWVLHDATRQAAAWQRAGHHLVTCINLSARELNRPGLLGDVRKETEDVGVDPSLLNIEITERAPFTDLDGTMTTLTALRDLGVHITLDDFGTGYSALSWLQQLPVDTLKLDRSFTIRLGEHPPTSEIVSSIIHLSHALGIETIGEGVETADQLEQLRDLGCDAAQGFHLGRPVLPAALALPQPPPVL